jgi:hypothetical protein
MSRANICGEPTDDKTPCGLRPLAGRAGAKCYRHAGLEATEAQREASKANPVQHGLLVRGFLDEQERQLFEQVASGNADAAKQRANALGMLAVRAARAHAWESEELALNELAASAIRQYWNAICAPRATSPEAKPTLDAADVHAKVQAVLQDKELLLRQFPPRIQAVIREALAQEAA